MLRMSINYEAEGRPEAPLDKPSWIDLSPAARHAYIPAFSRVGDLPVEALSVGIDTEQQKRYQLIIAKQIFELVEDTELPHIAIPTPDGDFHRPLISCASGTATIVENTEPLQLFIFGRHRFAPTPFYEQTMRALIKRVNTVANQEKNPLPPIPQYNTSNLRPILF
jgi:hypothetical protein